MTNTTNTDKLFYRFRSIKRLLEKDELKNQEIYFAHPSELNDPMEGYRNIFWLGDKIIWVNFFKHYLYCLQNSYQVSLFTEDLSGDDIPVFGKEDNLPSELLKEVFNEICENFFNIKNIGLLIEKISKRSIPLYKPEIELVLQAVHLIALKIVVDGFKNKKLISGKLQEELTKNPLKSTIKGIPLVDSLIKEDIDESKMSILHSIVLQMQKESHLILKYNNKIRDLKKDFLVLDYPSFYIKAIEKLCFPEWYTACFMSECSNSSIWGHYGENHSGVCLIFKSDVFHDGFSLNLQNELHKSINSNFPFYDIKYDIDQSEIDFFRSLGNVNASTLNKMWYYSKNGKKSVCSDDFFHSEDEWRKRYWESFYKDINRKSPDWEYEKEYRLITTNTFYDLSSKDSRTKHYDFSSLEGIVFGINTKDDDKIEIIKIIKEKCRQNRKYDFNFYQAYYSHKSKCIDKHRMSFLKFKEKKS